MSDFDREVVRLAKEVKSGENNIVDEAISLELREYLDKEFFEKLDNINEKNPKILVVFAGGNAVGKSTLSAKIVKEFQGLRLNNDDIRRAIVRKFPELARTQRVNQLLWQYSMDMYDRLESMTSNGLIIRDAIITGSYEKVLPKFEARRYRLFVVGYNLSDEKIQQLIIDRGDVDITTVPRMLSQMEFHKQNRQRFFREYDADIMLDDESVFEHDRVIDALRETINAAD